jgi:excisionase family DNA binding protein
LTPKNQNREQTMTTPATAQPFGDRLPSEQERAAANQLRQIIAAQVAEDHEVKLRLLLDKATPAEVVLTPTLSALLMDLLRTIGSGDAVTLIPVSQQLTTQQAADILNVSRPHLIKLLENGEMKFETTGRHRRIRAVDLFEYKKRRDKKRSGALEELAQLDADLL